MVDWEMLMRRATAGLNVPDKALVDAREGLISAGKHAGFSACWSTRRSRAGALRT